jgi:hypothetical protein
VLHDTPAGFNEISPPLPHIAILHCGTGHPAPTIEHGLAGLIKN